MSSVDPLNLLLGQKKNNQAQKAAAPSAGASTGSLAAGIDDVSKALGRSSATKSAATEHREGEQRQQQQQQQQQQLQQPQQQLGRAVASFPADASQPLPESAHTVKEGVGGPAGTAAPSFDDILLGERVHVTLKNCFLMVPNPLCEVRGRLLVTNFRLRFQTPKGTLREDLVWMQEAKCFDIPMGLVEETKEERSTTITGSPEFKFVLKTKDFRTLTVLLVAEEDLQTLREALTAFSIPGNPTLLFAVRHAEEVWASGASCDSFDGWRICDFQQEFLRMGVETHQAPCLASPWRATRLNTDYSLCSSYPAILALPRQMSDRELTAVANFRKRGRLPAMSWCGGQSLCFASLWRCSQTTEGLMGQKSAEDQRMVEMIRRGSNLHGGADRDLLVIDLRPWKSAWANKAGGGGFEGYPRCQLVFGNIDNIHAVREAWHKMGAAVSAVSEGSVGSWWKDVASSCWYDYIGAILQCAQRVVKEIADSKGSVLVHCSDGWDRTAQVTSVSMLCLDPDYRTQSGFLRLIEKEWCSFGHRFRTRLALGEQPSGEYSPVFIQWLECVFQLCQQFPAAFEFDHSILLRLGHDVYTNQFGTFLCDNERERTEKVMPFTLSLWSRLLRLDEVVTWRNPLYRQHLGPLVPSMCQANFDVWEAYWFRYHPRGQRARTRAASSLALSVETTHAQAVQEACVDAKGPEARSPEKNAQVTETPKVTETPPRKMPIQVFADDDEDEDVFTRVPH